MKGVRGFMKSLGEGVNQSGRLGVLETEKRERKMQKVSANLRKCHLSLFRNPDSKCRSGV